MASLRYEEIENEEEIFRCFKSPARIGGEKVSIGVDQSRLIKEAAVLRGFLDDNGQPFPWVGWAEQLTAILRHVETPADYNHEWWSQHVSKPGWVITLETMVMKLCLHYPQAKQNLEAKEIGSRLGYELTLMERKCGDAVSTQSILEQWENLEFENELAGAPPEIRDRVEVLFLGTKSFLTHVSAQLESTKELRKLAFQLSQEGTLQESQEFLSGYLSGSNRANKICDHKHYWQFDERQAVAETLQGYWDSIEMLPTLAEVTVFIRRHLPDKSKQFLEQNPEADAAFAERSKKLYQKIGLKKGSAGRPRK